MANDGLEKFEAVLGAISKITSEDKELLDARCPKCKASDFIQISDLYSEAVGRLEEQPDAADTVRIGGLTDAQIVAKFRPPRRRSAAIPVIAVAVPLGAICFYVYRRFGDTVGQLTIAGACVIVAIVLLTSLRRLSDEYYHGRRRWNSLFMCRQCGQLVAS